jgi:hypothetical protein
MDKMTAFQVGQTYKTRDGHAARVVATDMKGPQPIVALMDCAAMEVVIFCSHDGRYYHAGDSEWDLLPPEPAAQYVWLNVYADGGLPLPRAWRSRYGADEMAADNRIGCIKVKLEARFDEE